MVKKLLLFMTLMLLAGVTQAQIITNGGFETGDWMLSFAYNALTGTDWDFRPLQIAEYRLY